jgi:hypothetical protein
MMFTSQHTGCPSTQGGTTFPPACRKTLRAGKITAIVSFKRAKLTVYI